MSFQIFVIIVAAIRLSNILSLLYRVQMLANAVIQLIEVRKETAPKS